MYGKPTNIDPDRKNYREGLQEWFMASPIYVKGIVVSVVLGILWGFFASL